MHAPSLSLYKRWIFDGSFQSAVTLPTRSPSPSAPLQPISDYKRGKTLNLAPRMSDVDPFGIERTSDGGRDGKQASRETRNS